MTAAILYVTLSAAAYYLVSRAKLTEPLWRNYPKPVEYWTLCAACSGFWYGACAAVLLGRPLHLDFAGLPSGAWYTPLVAGLASMVWTPIVGRAMVVGWMDLLQTDEEDPP
jgi:hypothetical protein